MARVRGLEHFSKFFTGFEDHYVIIGGTAASVLMEEGALDYRGTKDIDLVILSDPSQEIAARIIEYVGLGQYEIKQSSEGKPKYYRFTEPRSDEFPFMLEIFARNAAGLDLEAGQRIVPVLSDSADRLSAILLDDEYFDLIKANAIQSSSGYRIINHMGNICMKARAFKELTERKAAGERGDKKEIDKHRNDILKLALHLTTQDNFPLGGRPEVDLKFALTEIRQLPEQQVKSIMKDYPDTNVTELLQAIKKTFLNAE